ncbi:MAG: hypothetical protein A2Z20_07185 [Bdellovibrionales bacterium RBG_16_40_8]|nr:MAG: hypothetical protein A2Z20_07185 [Bdellovibrionales bacterium RBG_16_40_8]
MSQLFKSIVLALVLTTSISNFKIDEASAASDNSQKMNLGEPLPANMFIELAKIINPTVVNISTSILPQQRQMRRGYPQDPFFDMFEQFMGPQMQAPLRPQQGLGTGFIIRSDGLILTNNHVVENADIIKIQLSENDRALYTAELIGRDKRSDLALIKIDAKKPLPAAKFGSSKSLQVGEWVAAFGNPLGLGHTTSKGIISAIGREIGELNRFPFIQTDASINPGNSGGPLVNLKGEVVGVNTAIAANSQGIGFAIPIDEAKTVIASLEKEGVVKHGFIGVNMYPYPINPQAAQEMGLPRTNGMLIVGVIEGSPAEKAGFKEYDFIIKFNGQDVDSAKDFSNMIADADVGKTYKIEYIRDGKTRTTNVILEESPDDKKQSSAKKKTYRGQRAPFDLGFTVTNFSQELEKEFGLSRPRKAYPVVIDVDYDGPAAKAGLGVGDIIIDVNRKEVTKDTDVLKQLKNNQINSLRILRGEYLTLIYINPSKKSSK